MRWKVFILLSIFLISSVVAVVPDDCDDSMVSYWRMEENVDDSGTGNHNGVWDGVPIYFPNIVGSSAKFDGNEKINISGVGNFLESFSIEMMVESGELYQANDVSLFQKGDYAIGFDDNKLVAKVGNEIFGTTSISIDEQYHIALVRDNDTFYFYVNGVEIGNITISISPSGSGDITIGDGFMGFIDEVATYTSALDDTTIRFHYSRANAGRDYCSLSGSGSKTDWVIDGCDDNGDSVAAGGCSKDSEYFCDNSSGIYLLQDVLLIPNACSFGSLDAIIRGDPQCCPTGHICKFNTSLVYSICTERTEDCSTFNNSDDCEDENCYWLGDENGSCIEDPTEYSCGVYTTNTSCEADVFGLGVNGQESDVCGTYFQISDGSYWVYDNCSCKWEDETCGLNYLVTCFIGENCGSFECFKDFETGECIDGSQTVSWTATPKERTGPFNKSSLTPPFNESLYNEVVEASCSANKGIERSCGEAIVKLPGFSLFSFVMVIGESN